MTMAKRKKKRITEKDKKWIVITILTTVASVFLAWGLTKAIEQFIDYNLLESPFFLIGMGILIMLLIIYKWDRIFLAFR